MSWQGGDGPERAHRVYYTIVKGEIPPKVHVHHKCENRKCVNPEHLTIMAIRAHGRLTPRAKVTFEDVREIRKRRREGVRPSVLAAEYGVTRQHICSIVAGRVWQEDVCCPNCGHSFDPNADRPLT